MPNNESALFNELMRKSNHPQQIALATVNGQIRGGAFERADHAFEQGRPPSYRPDWDAERTVLADILEPYTEEPPTDRQFQKYKDAWVERFELAHEKGHTDF